jgi:hypothetical protein
MAVEFTNYQPPGIYTQDDGGPQFAVRSTVPTAVAIFGVSVGYETYRESVKIRPDVVVGGNTVGALSGSSSAKPGEPPALAKKGIEVVNGVPEAIINFNVNISGSVPTTLTNGLTGAAAVTINLSVGTSTVPGDLFYLIGQNNPVENGLYRYVRVDASNNRLVPITDTFRVINPTTGVAYYNGKDYLIEQVAYEGEDGTTARDNKYAIRRVTTGSIQPGKVVQLIYRYTDPTYYEVKSLYDYDDVREAYGEPFNADGSIRSEVTLAAKFAMLNGASNLLTCAVDLSMKNSEGVTLTSDECYARTLDKFLDEPQAAIIVPAIGDGFIWPLVKAHVTQQSQERFERRAIVGFDGSGGKVSSSTRQDLVETIAEKRVAMVSPSRFEYRSTELGRPVTLGGQYMAAAIAGKSVSQIAAMPLTRKVIQGFIGPEVDDVTREGEKSTESSVGLMVVEKTRRGQVQVRHGVTTDPTDLLTAEWSIIGQQDVMVYRIRDYLEADGLIGMPIYDTTLVQVKASAEAALVALQRDGIIVGFQNLKVRQLATAPQVVEVRYEWKPAYPLNYILVRYSVWVMNGDITPTVA